MNAPLRTSIDLPALHAAYRAEGFVPAVNADASASHTRYMKIGVPMLHASVPNSPADESDLYDKLEELHADAAGALRFLWEVTGNAHCEVGSLIMTDEDYGYFDGKAICRECGHDLDEAEASAGAEYCPDCGAC